MIFSVEYSRHHPDTGESAIWFYMTFRADGQVRVVETSDTMWDIGSLLQWLEDIVAGNDEARLDVDREGQIDTLLAIPVDGRTVRLVIRDDLNDCEDLIYLDAAVDRRELVAKTYEGLLRFIKSAGLVGRGGWSHENGEPVHHETTDLGSLNSKKVEAWLNSSR